MASLASWTATSRPRPAQTIFKICSARSRMTCLRTFPVFEIEDCNRETHLQIAGPVVGGELDGLNDDREAERLHSAEQSGNGRDRAGAFELHGSHRISGRTRGRFMDSANLDAG